MADATWATANELAERIEARVTGVRRDVRAALSAFLAGGAAPPPDGEPISPRPVTVDDLDRYALEWAWLVPSDPVERHQLIQVLVDRLGAAVLERPRLRHALALVPEENSDSAAVSVGMESAATALDALEQAAEYVVVRGGETLMRQGDPSDSLYLVLTGRLAAAQATPAGGERLISEILRGTTIGEIGTLTGAPRSARVFALRDSHLLRVPAATLTRILARFPELLRGVVQTLIARDRTVDRRPLMRTLAVLPLGADLPVGAFAQALVAALARHGAARLVDRAEAEGRLRHESGWLTRLEETYRFVVYQAEPEASDWTARCLRQADRILLVGLSTSSWQPTAAERLVAEAGIGSRELVLLHPPGPTAPLDTRRWLAQRRLLAHHHLRQDSQTDLRRLARHLAGRAVGLVLGGGGARAFAHIGAIRALEEAGVPIDVVGGVSAGAIVAAEYAVGWGPAELYARNRAIASHGRALIDYTLPLVALIQARKFTALLERMFGERRIEDLWLPFWCLSSNLTRAEKIVHRSGLLAAAVRASCALPGVLPPVLLQGDVVVDGGLLDTVPVTTMREVLDGAGFTVAIDVSAEVDLTRPYAFGPSVSGLRLLWERVKPFGNRTLVAPSLAAVLLRSIELGSVMAQRGQDEASLFIKPPVAHVDRLAFDQANFDQLVEIGYRHTRDALCRWQGLAEVRAD